MQEDKIFFTSDLHFMHGNILRYGRGEHFESLQQMNEGLVKAWNNTVGENDLVFDLGDISIGSTARTLEYLSQLNGYIVHLKGNHNTLEEYEKFNEVLGEKQVFLETPVLTQEFNGQTVVMCHYPFAVWDRQHYGSWNLHGHTHGSLPDTGNKRLDVGVDPAMEIFGEHRPISFAEIRIKMEGRSNETIDGH